MAKGKERLPEQATEDEVRDALGEGHALVRMQDDQLQQISVGTPRPGGEMILEQACKEVDLFPDITSENYYSIPYKNRGEEGGTTYVQGISVKGSNNLARLYGNCAVSQGVLEVRENDATVVGTFLDYESRVIFRNEQRCSRFQVRRGGSTVRLDETRWNMLIASTASKAKRNATLDGLPSWLKARYFQHCLKLATGKVKDAAKAAGRRPWQEMMKAFQAIGVSREDLEALLGYTLPRVTDEDLGKLRGIYNGIKSGDLNRQDVFASSGESEQTTSVEDALAASADAAASEQAEGEKLDGARKTAGAESERTRPEVAKGEACPDCHRTWEIHTDVGHAVGCKFRE